MENKQNYSLLPRFILPRYQYVVDTFISIGIVAFIIGKIYKDQDTKSTKNLNQETKKFNPFEIILSKITNFGTTLRCLLQIIINHKNNHHTYDDNANGKPLHNPDYYLHALQIDAIEVPANCTEPYIIKGYPLPYMPWRYYLKVLYYPTNETFNVWTHLIPSILFTKMLYDFNEEMDLIEAWPLLVLTIAVIWLTLASSLAHTFHSRSDYYHRCWFMIDYFGISCYAYSSTVCHFFASSDIQYYSWIGGQNLMILSLICCAGFTCCSVSQLGFAYKTTKQARRYKMWSNMLGYFYGLLPVLHRSTVAYLNGMNDRVLLYHYLQIVFMVLSPVWYSSDIPQKYWPGKFDIFGHSHQIFHIFCATACYFDLTAVYFDVTEPDGPYNKLKQQADYPSFQTFLSYSLGVFLFCLCIGVYFAHILKKSKNKEFSSKKRFCAASAYFSTSSRSNTKSD